MMALAGLLGALVSGGLFLLAAGLSGRVAVPTRQRQRAGRGIAWSSWLLWAAGALGAAATVGAASGWPVAALLTLAAFPLIPRLLRERSADRGVIKRLEALATWTELLRDTLHAAAGIEGAITATAPLAPLAVRPHVERIAGRLRRMDPGDSLATALRDFADAMDHYVADTVVLSLIAATERQGGRLTEQLDAAARDARDLVTFYRETETERVEVRATVRIVMAVTVGWALLLTLVSPGYFSFYGTPVGQLVLLFGPGCLFGLSIGWQVRLSRLPRQPRLLMPLQPGKLTPEHHHHLIPLDGHVGISA